MKINSLSQLKSSIKNIIVVSLLAICLLFSALLSIYYKLYSQKNAELEKESIYGTIKIYESNISEKLSIIASSNIFKNYLRSGEISRAVLLPDFLDELRLIGSKTILGMDIQNLYEVEPYKADVLINQKLQFHSGTYSNDKITLRVCYLDKELNGKFGHCRYLWILYLDTRAIIADLKNINPNIELCTTCKPLEIVTGKWFGSFPIVAKSNIIAQISQARGDKYYLYFYVLLVFISLIIFAILNNHWVNYVIERYVAKPLRNISNKLKHGDPLSESGLNVENDIEEIQYLIGRINDWSSQLDYIQKQKKAIEIGEITAQLAHDIRAPAAALKVIADHQLELPDKQRSIIRNAIYRINDIANSLLSRYKRCMSVDNAQESCPSDLTSILIPSAINSILSEKRLQYRDRNIEFACTIGNFYTFAMAQPLMFKRVLSNIIDNSVEAIKENSRISLAVFDDGRNIKIQVTDNGIGIAPELLPQIFDKGFSFGKKAGSGLGLFYSKECVEAWGGSILAESTIGYGSVITILLPKVETPGWFATEIKLKRGGIVAIVDDEQCVHDAWALKFQERLSDTNIKIMNFLEPQAFANWYLSQTGQDITCLLDYEFTGFSETGLDLIDRLRLNENVVLITGRYEEQNLIEQCCVRNIKISPKDYMAYIKIHILESS